MTDAFADTVPIAPELTDYDRAHIKLYARLLDATADGAGWEEVVSVLFGIEVAHEPERARHVHDSHLARTRWAWRVDGPGSDLGRPQVRP
ncbi:MAG: DUF2285 domain-containing protein [Rhizobiales bacterium 24-66-13]|jgi:hypothetical protein|uniref:DUF2285 domain-containing protein n=1 Tax=Roseixanthobacter finlandensis TaxID=3119922 RepID=UPI000BC672AC|nr:MAG: DUF2285 domain-containing protein [Rhizobiales bacterium 35-66-30]OYZ79842.1 MAG: DUF2285 domain-containing protein [Rhizobiales bacterium 24-66-13]OZB07461.1 MAG: DUF2285 domain-containing protein [Rhizobiales bacterium 39-66-18]HQS08570.1 DUF2285 domain-containing protein [Xanthobacteraceae bacterium]HQS45597.1 DUF2285 domain-containing protein [Xanthobacteraceae bacterium]